MENINPIIIELLKKRGICTQSEISEFLSDKPQETHDPFLLHDMEAGVDLLLQHINAGNCICVYGDYDADGVTSTALLMTVFEKMGAKAFYYIPSRFDEGYGLNMDAMETVKKQGADLVVTVDCGSVSCKEVEYARELGMDIIVTDHHRITDQKADCILINPNQDDCSYPFKPLAGVGVAFKLAQALKERGVLPKSVLPELLDLVAIGTVADIMPLRGENRTFVKYGLNVLKQGRRPGTVALMNAISLSPENFKADKIAFGIAPHINAAGRVADARLGVELLLAKTDEKARELAQKLVECNNIRKQYQDETYQMVVPKVEEFEKDKPAIVVYAEDAHEGIIGIVAGKIKSEYGKPTLIVTTLSEDDQMLKGTGRSVDGVSIYQALKSIESLFAKFGGHSGACGFSMPKENLQQLIEEFPKAIQREIDGNPEGLADANAAELSLKVKDIDLEFINQLEMLEPFGQGNKKPLIEIKDAELEGVSLMGTENQHMRFSACNFGKEIRCVLFQRAQEYLQTAENGKTVTIRGYAEVNVWKDNAYPQFTVEIIEEQK